MGWGRGGGTEAGAMGTHSSTGLASLPRTLVCPCLLDSAPEGPNESSRLGARLYLPREGYPPELISCFSFGRRQEKGPVQSKSRGFPSGCPRQPPTHEPIVLALRQGQGGSCQSCLPRQACWVGPSTRSRERAAVSWGLALCYPSCHWVP